MSNQGIQFRCADYVNDGVALCFGRDVNLELEIQSIPGARWSRELKAWLVPCALEVRHIINKRGFDVTERLQKAIVDGRLDRPLRVVNVKNGRLDAWFSYDERIVALMNSLGGVFDPKRKIWSLPLAHKIVEWLKDKGFSVAEDVYEALACLRQEAAKSQSRKGEYNVPGLKMSLLPYQQAGVRVILERKRVLLADDPGLGKTAQALAALQARKDLRPAVIVCPASLKINWWREAQKFLEDCPENRVVILAGTKPYVPEEPILIVNYDILDAWLPVLKDSAKFFVADESHYIKNPSAKRTKAARAASKKAEMVVCISGTPVLNRPLDLFTQLNLLAPREFPDLVAYGKRYCAGRRKEIVARGGIRKKVWDFSGASNLDELNERLRATVMIRRLKDDVLDELPPKRLARVYLELESPEEYLKAEDQFVEWLKEQAKTGLIDRKRVIAALRAQALVKVEYLKQCLARLKMPAVLEWVENFLASGRKLVVFVHHRTVGSALVEKFPRAAVLRGSSSPEEKDRAVQQFQEDPGCQLFIGSLMAAGTGLTLTAASDVAFVEYPWRPADFDQAADRCHRIGQKNSVTVWCLVGSAPGRETVDEKALKILDAKRAVAEKALDGEAASEGDVLAELLSSYLCHPRDSRA